MGLSDDILKKLKEEIINDPESLGYSRKSDLVIAQMLSSGFTRTQTNIEIIYHISPINRVLAGIANSSNTVTAIEITQTLSK